MCKFVTPEAGAKHELLLNNPVSGQTFLYHLSKTLIFNNVVSKCLNGFVKHKSDLSSTAKCDPYHIFDISKFGHSVVQLASLY